MFVGAWRNGGWHSRWGLEATGNLYLSESSHLSVSPGIIVSDSPYPDGFAGYSLGVGFGINDWAGVSSRLDLTRSPESSCEAEFHSWSEAWLNSRTGRNDHCRSSGSSCLA